MFFIICSISFAQKKMLILETYISNNYAVYAVYDIIVKNIFLYCDFQIIPNHNNIIKNNSYSNIKYNIKKLTEENNADILIAYNVSSYEDKGFILSYLIFNTEKPYEWTEKNIYSKEENFFNSLNIMIKDIYSMSLNNKDIHYIKKDEYISLIGYYNNKIKDENQYKLFFDFYKDNIYFNMDYMQYLYEKSDIDSIRDISIILNNTEKYLTKKNHYYLSVLGDFYYGKYKVNAESEDIEKAIENYKKSIEAKKDYYIYYKKLAQAYILKNDYENAAIYYNLSLKIYDKDINLIKDAVYLLKRDMNKNGNLVIEYLKKIINLNKNDDEALEELAGIYEDLKDEYNSEIYYKLLLEAVNYNLYIINNEKPNTVLYDKYTKKRNEIIKKLE
ncbi:hypothetical protein [uncultured Brachyspira sp.]|uniref:tetratricopeptide repeat protein n=1 Tax=uncultured Brachyspira sp. TaxID=221953 RepID=UPI0026011834|nr:hypothetical protein [uncultured Brachyspira sp.]